MDSVVSVFIAAEHYCEHGWRARCPAGTRRVPDVAVWHTTWFSSTSDSNDDHILQLVLQRNYSEHPSFEMGVRRHYQQLGKNR